MSARLQVCNKFLTILHNSIYIDPFSSSFSVSIDLYWSISTYLGSFRSILVHFILLYFELSLSISGYLVLSWAILDKNGISRAISGYFGLSHLSLAISGYLWLSLAISGYLGLSQLSLAISGYLWLSLAISDYL